MWRCSPDASPAILNDAEPLVQSRGSSGEGRLCKSSFDLPNDGNVLVLADAADLVLLTGAPLACAAHLA
jgi:hypothetical protein